MHFCNFKLYSHFNTFSTIGPLSGLKVSIQYLGLKSDFFYKTTKLTY